MLRADGPLPIVMSSDRDSHRRMGGLLQWFCFDQWTSFIKRMSPGERPVRMEAKSLPFDTAALVPEKNFISASALCIVRAESGFALTGRSIKAGALCSFSLEESRCSSFDHLPVDISSRFPAVAGVRAWSSIVDPKRGLNSYHLELDICVIGFASMKKIKNKYRVFGNSLI